MNDMNRSKVKFHHLLTVLLSAIVWITTVNLSKAQDDVRESQSVSISTTPDGKVKLKVIKQVGNDETTFEKTYDSYDDIAEDPDLEKYGIDLNGFGVGGNRQPKFFFHNGPGMGFWDDDDFGAPMEEFRNRMKQFMDQDWGGNAFGFDFDDGFMDMDSIMKQFDFRNDNGNFFFNGKQFEDLDSLRESLKGRFGNFMFDFDADENANSWRFSSRDEDDEVKVISRKKLAIRPATVEDKMLAGVDKSSPLVLRDISFYPNPSDGRFEMSLESDSDAAVEIIVLDENGSEVIKRNERPENGTCSFQIDLTKQEKGKYVLKVVQGKRALSKRLVLD